MTTWEYKSFYSDRDEYKGFLGFKLEKFEEKLNELGSEGWRECDISYFQESN